MRIQYLFKKSPSCPEEKHSQTHTHARGISSAFPNLIYLLIVLSITHSAYSSTYALRIVQCKLNQTNILLDGFNPNKVKEWECSLTQISHKLASYCQAVRTSDERMHGTKGDSQLAWQQSQPFVVGQKILLTCQLIPFGPAGELEFLRVFIYLNTYAISICLQID